MYGKNKPNMKKQRTHIALTFMFFLMLSSCKRTAEPNNGNLNPDLGNLKITFKNTINGAPVFLDGRFYTNSFGENYVLKKFKYYISNVQINNIDKYANENESYHLIDEASEASKSFMYQAATDIYTTLSFTIGVDSVRNVSGAQSGALDPLNDMFWTWNSGYIMAKIEATSPSSAQVNNKVEYHIGGFSGVNNVLKRVTLALPLTKLLTVQKDKTSEIIITADLDAWWQNPNNLKISDNPICTTPGDLAKKIADNYSKMFTIKEVINN
jgi:hypothetical protein